MSRRKRLLLAALALLVVLALALALALARHPHHDPCIRFDPQDEPAGLDYDAHNCPGVR